MTKNELNQAFLVAAERGDEDALKSLIEKGANPLTKNEYGNGALHLAAMHAPDGQGIQWLLEVAEIDIEDKGPHGMTPFLSAANTSNLAALKILHQAGANTQAEDIQNKNALHFAALFDSEGETIHWLIHTAHIPIERKSQHGDTPFLCAARWLNLTALKTLYKEGANVKATSPNGTNALQHVVGKYFEEEDPNEKVADQNGTELLQQDDPQNFGREIIHWLIHTARISTEAQGDFEKTAVIYAAERGNFAALKILYEQGANMQATDRNGNTILHYAAIFAPEGKGIHWLIHTVHIPIEIKNKNGDTPFLCAHKEDNVASLKILYEQGANVKATDCNGNNALHLAAMFGSHKAIAWLIKKVRIPVESRGHNGKTPVLFAAEGDHLWALQILREKGANFKAKCQYGHGALYYAEKDYVIDYIKKATKKTHPIKGVLLIIMFFVFVKLIRY